MLAMFGGIVAVVIGIVLLFGGPLFNLPLYMWDDFIVCLKGALSSGLVLGGILAVFIGVSTIKENLREKSEKKEEEAKKTT
ncbi:MAG TPA: hypothetical protein DHV62_07030 [Elusimicrobia bacterium]|jgi:putative Mn2+ efflux pump MntP|nr:hypothetical protein [Elusimicrobiota bacterium]